MEKKSVNRAMPTSTKTTSVTLWVSTADILREIYVGKGKQYEKISEAANDIIVNHCKLKEVIDEQYHHLSFRAVGKEVFVVKDSAKGMDAEIVVDYDVKLNKNRLYCTLDKSTYCDHIGFAVTQPSILHMEDIRKVSKKRKD